MMFRTELHPTPSDFKLNLNSKVITVGSCFSDVIGHQLEKYKIDTLTNPFGTIFNPLSACKLLQVCAGADVELADSFLENQGRWFSYDFHSSFSATSEEELYEILDEAVVKTRRFLKQADVLILTLGTANVFRLNITGETVANCHKMPASTFTRETLLPEEIIASVAETQSLLRELNPNLKLVLTVSPVRHLKDTLELNSVSKSVLRLATHYLSSQLPAVSYFPAYELLLDDLRDYRFYKEDLLHPTDAAEKYIWEKFSFAYCDKLFQTFVNDWDSVLRAMAHKPFHPESSQHQAFIQNILEKLHGLQTITDCSKEIAFFESQVIIPPVIEEPEESEEEEEEELETGVSEFETEEDVETSETASLEATTEKELTETGKKRRKKPRRKKKKPQTENIPSEATEIPAIVEELPSEIEIHTTEEETETEIPEENLPAKISRSAKKRANRKKKKALAAQESFVIPEVSDEIAALLQPETEPAAAALKAEHEASLSENIKAPVEENSVEIIAESVPEPKNKPAKKRGGKAKKPAFTELFATEVPVEAEHPVEAISETISIVEPTPEDIQPEPAAPKRRGRTKKEKTVEVDEAAVAVESTPVPEPEVPKTTRKRRTTTTEPKTEAKSKSKAKTTAKSETESANPEKPKRGRKKKTATEE